MYKNILVPTDGSEFSFKAVKSALRLAQIFNSNLTILHAVMRNRYLLCDDAYGFPEPVFLPESYKRAQEIEADKWLSALEVEAKDAHVECVKLVVKSNFPWQAIVEAAKERNCDLIVMASHCHHGIKAVLFGDETAKVLHHSEIPVLVCH